MQKYDTCPKCKVQAVHLATANNIPFYGDGDDQVGSPSQYEGVEPVTDVEVCVLANICFQCGYLVDVGIEYPRERALNTSAVMIATPLTATRDRRYGR